LESIKVSVPTTQPWHYSKKSFRGNCKNKADIWSFKRMRFTKSGNGVDMPMGSSPTPVPKVLGNSKVVKFFHNLNGKCYSVIPVACLSSYSGKLLFYEQHVER
jgi:hypothetical protein